MSHINAKRKDKEKGFTLIELSIVLVIIGLIVGGVLVGQDLIKAAELRATASQIEKYNTAVNTFRLKYNGLPGDLSSPATYFSVTNGNETNQGDGDGIIEGVSNTSNALCTTLCQSGESLIFWYMLGNAGMIAESVAPTDYEDLTITPATDAVSMKGGSGHVGIMGAGGRNYFVLANFGATNFSSGSTTYTAALTPVEAFQLDSKIDDGVPNSGGTVSVAVAAPAANTASAGNCYASNAYAVNSSVSDTPNCNLSIRASF